MEKKLRNLNILLIECVNCKFCKRTHIIEEIGEWDELSCAKTNAGTQYWRWCHEFEIDKEHEKEWIGII